MGDERTNDAAGTNDPADPGDDSSGKKAGSSGEKAGEQDLYRVIPWNLGKAVLMSTVLLLLLRIMTRITMSNLHLCNDASERVVMIKTYESLLAERMISKDNSKDDKRIELVLNALFRQSNTGLVKEDATSGLSITELALATKLGK